jgi:hypothetical protein
MTHDELKIVLEKHLKWSRNQVGGERAILRGAILCGANLREAILYGADLRGANLCGANLYGAHLRGAKNIPFLPQLEVCPQEGGFIAYKKLRDNKIAKLQIPEHAKRSNATTRKCRCSEALVLEITNKNGDKVESGNSNYNNDFIYIVGKIVIVDNFDDNRWNECSKGIHFFMTKQEAIDYDL